MLADGLIRSWWALLALPAVMLVGFAFAAVGMAATTYLRSWQDFDFVTVAMMPMFLFSTTFYPLGVYPRPVQLLVECTPLYHGIELLRSFSTGAGVGPGLLWHVGYLLVMLVGGLTLAGRRLERELRA
jgi:lipooligosaccharide transport system permease protein